MSQLTDIAGEACSPMHGQSDAQPRRTRGSALEKFLILKCIVLVVAIGLGTTVLLTSLRDQRLADTERHLDNVALILAEQTERTFQAAILVQESVIEHVHALGVASPEEFDQRMSTIDVHHLLRNKLTGLPFVNTLAVLSSKGRLVNFARFWPMPPSDFSDRSYVREVVAHPATGWWVSEPTQSRVSGLWTIYMSRAVTGRDGRLLGIVAGAIALDHFEKFFGSIALMRGSSVALVRNDGILLVRHPQVESFGSDLSQRPNLKRIMAGPKATTFRSVAVMDGQDRIFAARKLSGFPITAIVTNATSVALANWRLQATFILAGSALAIIAIVIAFALILRDLRHRTDRTRRQLAAQKLKLDVALEQMSQGLCMFDAHARLVMWNERYIQIYGLPRELVRPGATLGELIHYRKHTGTFAGDPDAFIAELKAAGVAGRTIKHVVALPDGRSIYIVQEPVATGGWVATHEDITDRRKAELERDRNREFLDRVIENIPSTVLVRDAAEGRYLLVNKAAEDLCGLPRSEILGKTVRELFRADVAERIARRDEQLLQSGTELFFDERPLTMMGGRMRHVTARTICMRAEDGKPQYLLVVIDDVTERRLVEQQLQQAQRMEAVGRLTGGLAHDFNNLLLIIIGNLDMLANDVRGDRAAAEKVETILQSSLRGAELTRQLLAFSRRQPLAPKCLQVNRLLESTAKLLHRTLGQDITIALKLAPDLWTVSVDEAQLEAAVVNIAINARDAMPDGGKLAIETRNARLDADYCGRHPDVTPGDFVVIEVTDNGTGMPPDVLSRIFEPFFTTKGPAIGTGLGLSMVFGFMRQSGGHINAYSEVGLGTTFKLYLPRAQGDICRPEDEARPAAAEPARGSNETILVVEDDPTIRSMVAAQLRDLGYVALEADDALEALNKLATTRVDLLLTDMIMPGETNGKQLATMARLNHPNLKVLYTSGFPGGPDSPGARLQPADVLLKKPYRKGDLAHAVRDVLDRPKPEARQRSARERAPV
jgi:PAS domain S-box-containing protein